MSVRAHVESTMLAVAAEHGKDLQQLNDELLLVESGLDSLCFAVIVAKLEDELGVDPFTSLEIVAFPKTVGDFVALYELAFA